MAKIEIKIALAMSDRGAYFVTFGEDGLNPQEAIMLGSHLTRLGSNAELLNMLLAEKIPLTTVKKIAQNL